MSVWNSCSTYASYSALNTIANIQHRIGDTSNPRYQALQSLAEELIKMQNDMYNPF